MDAALDLLGLGQPCQINLVFDGAQDRPYVKVAPAASNHKETQLPLYGTRETVSGRVAVSVKEGKALQHLGVRIEFVGLIELLYDRDQSQEFVSLLRELDEPGNITGTKQYTFAFTDVEKSYDTYYGLNVQLRYVLRVTIQRQQYAPNIVREFNLAVQHTQPGPEVNNSIRMEVGIEDVLHIEFDYDRTKYHLTDVVRGWIYFVIVKIKIKRMEIEIKRKETAGTASSNVHNETDIIGKFEVMDGAPVRNEKIPIRMFLSAYDNLTPTYRSINNMFSVRYFLNLVLVDDDDRRYFKQTEVVLWRAKPQAA
eukprot:Plantae.Rhodophyta-Purpureofilum_apyrenoidigerum.ctg23320.p1 GENE.Plantae.Rhodophyta-Purpureofilum_apyrenoidigerum.ctg23320~~Plantae.Rhodophyta-Purpureofilum_apyrenoidigerum.ctg23320.p1  ORF type:complete len:310 (+),score=67.98 Plantae.Rhodophyta-Purpureofilum_apyrenoidigerum.ctg23320:102-1031(+)